jgi:hypothetical protein
MGLGSYYREPHVILLSQRNCGLELPTGVIHAAGHVIYGKQKQQGMN